MMVAVEMTAKATMTIIKMKVDDNDRGRVRVGGGSEC